MKNPRRYCKLFLVTLVYLLVFIGWHDSHALVLTVNNTNDAGAGSLRQAILDSNTSVAVFDNIQFNIPSNDPGCMGGVCTIQPITVLPDITDPVEINGYTQSGSQPNTNGEGQGLNTVLTVVLDGSQTSNADGLTIATSGGGSRIAGLVINLFGTAGIFGAGINLDNSSDNLIEGNFLGTDPSGTLAQGNQTRGVFITGNSSNNNIGGSDPAVRNLISGNGERGIFLLSSAVDNVIQGNLIGTDISGTIALGNDNGINIQPSSTGNLVGGSQPGEGNVISGNVTDGIEIVGFAGSPAMDNLVQGNFIGTDVTGTQPLGNGGNGISIVGANVGPNLIGGTSVSQGNTIAFNQLAGVSVNNTTGQSILGNSIFENGSLGIELANGGNNNQAAPVLNSASSNNCVTTLEGSLNSNINTTYRLEFFSNMALDPSGNGEGMVFLDFLDVMTDGAGSVEFSINLPTSPTGPEFLTATATDQSNNTGDTSEFSNGLEVVGSGVLVFSSDNFSVEESAGSATITVMRICGSQGDVTVDFSTSDGTANSDQDYAPTAGTLSWVDGEVTDKTFDVQVFNDSASEGIETVLLNLSNPTGGAGLGDPSQAVLSISDSEGGNGSISGGACQLNKNSNVDFPGISFLGLFIALQGILWIRKKTL